MMINFCEGRMCSSVRCDKPCHDRYPATNLITDLGPLCWNEGFITESFVRPPVNVVITFPCNVIISKIIIDPCVGAHKTKKLELSTGTELVTSSWMVHDESVNKIPQPQYSPSRIGGITMSDPGVVCFENQRFYPSPPFSKDILSLAGDVEYRSVLGSKHPCSLNRVSRLILRLQQAGPTGVVALKRVEVWGQPSMCHRPAFDVCLNRFTGSTSTPQRPLGGPPDPKPDESAREQVPLAGGQVNEEDLPEIPEDFLDAITCELMAVPMLLPSGKNVDLSTLDKHRNAEAANGRSPFDPFTGLTYTQDREPVPNNCLKARIDGFLLKYSHCKNVTNLPRTVQTLAHSSASVWRPIGKRGPSAWTEPASARKKSRLINSDSCTSTNVSPNTSQVSDSSQSRSSASRDTPSPSPTSSREETPDPHRLVIVMEPSPTKGSNSKLDAEAAASSRVSQKIDTSYADQVLKQSNIVMYHPAYSYNISLQRRNNFSHADWSVPKTHWPSSLQQSNNYKPLHSNSPPSCADLVGATLKNFPSYRGLKSDAAATSSPSVEPGGKERDDSVCSGCGGSDSVGGECFYLLPCKHIVCRACALGKGKQTDDEKRCGRCGVEYRTTSIHRIH